MKKKVLIGLGVFIIVIIVSIFIFAQGGITKKGQFSKCMEVCYDLLFLESSKQYCPEQCTADTGYEPTQAELDEIIADLTNTNTESADTAPANVNTSSINKSITNTTVNKNTNTATNLNSDINININTNTTSANTNTATAIDKNAEFYCEWSWPQKIIYRETSEVIKRCTSARPWCNRADFTYENVGCCADREHTDCITLPNLL